MPHILIGAGAQADIENAYVWHETQQPGLGLAWLHVFEKALISVKAHPYRYALTANDIRRARFRRFSYSLYYRIDGNIIEVFGIFHDRQNPDDLQSRF